MDYSQYQRSSKRSFTGIGVVLAFHILLGWALVNGLGTKVVELVKGDLETKLIQEVKLPPPPPPEKSPPPKSAEPPPVNVPEVEIPMTNSTPVTNTITQVTDKPVPPPPAPVPAPPRQSVKVGAVVRANDCAKPEYPAASKRLEEEGVVGLSLLVDENGRVAESKITKSSGYPRLDQATSAALSLCKFKAATVDGVPEKSWAMFSYRWELNN